MPGSRCICRAPHPVEPPLGPAPSGPLLGEKNLAGGAWDPRLSWPPPLTKNTPPRPGLPQGSAGGQPTSIPGFVNPHGRHISKSPGSQLRKLRPGKSLQEGCQRWGPPTVIRDRLCLHPHPRYTPDLSSQGGPCPLSGWAPLMHLGRETWGNREGFLEEEGVGVGHEGKAGLSSPLPGPPPRDHLPELRASCLDPGAPGWWSQAVHPNPASMLEPERGSQSLSSDVR